MARGAAREVGVTAYAVAQDLLQPVFWVATLRAMRVYPKVRQRQYRALLAPSHDSTADVRWSTQRAVGTGALVAQYTP